MMSFAQSAPRRLAAACNLFCCVLLLGACAGSPATRYYTVASFPPSEPPRAGGAGVYRGPPIEVSAVQVPPAMDRLEMVRELAPGQVAVLDFDHWAAPLGRLTRQTLTEDLAQRLPKDKVAIPGAAWPEGRAVLTVDVLSFRILNGNATLDLSWALKRPGSGAAATPMPPIGATLRVETPAGGNAEDTARAWSELVAKVADRIAEALVR